MPGIRLLFYFAAKTPLMKITDLNDDEKPREKFLAEGPEYLSAAQLLAILLRTGTRTRNAVDVARDLLAEAGGSYVTLSEMNVEGMCRVCGIGPDKAVAVAAAFEIGRRTAREKESGSEVISSVEDAVNCVRPLFTNMEGREEFWCLYLKRSRRVLARERISSGGETLTDVNIKRIVRRAMHLGASAVIVSHNHPSGNPMPSAADIKATKQLRTALETFDLVLVDHIIVSAGGDYSFNAA